MPDKRATEIEAMNATPFALPADDGLEIFVYRWMPEDVPPRAVVQIAHGMAEHAARYERFAAALCQAGIGVYANDHRGHGRTAGGLENIGFFADTDGWNKVVADMGELRRVIGEENPGVPVFLFGHSMGSFLSRTFISRHGNEIQGVILSGTGGDPGLLGKVGLFIARTLCFLKGAKSPSPLLNALSFGDFNKPFRPNRTDFDWLSRDEAEVDKYVADPLCGAVFTAGFFVDLIGGINEIHTPDTYGRTPRDLPILLFSGAQDPVGACGSGVREVFDAYQKAGIEDIQMKLYEDGRHEMLNETNRQEVMENVIQWIQERL